MVLELTKITVQKKCVELFLASNDKITEQLQLVYILHDFHSLSPLIRNQIAR